MSKEDKPKSLTQQIHENLIRDGKMIQTAVSTRESLVSARLHGHAHHGRGSSPWRGHLAKKPWDYSTTAVIPHLNTPDCLELCIEFLQAQTEPVYVMVVDTGSDDSIVARVQGIRRENVEVHCLAHHGIENMVDGICAAMDMAMSICRTEYLWCLHSDCFVTNRNMLAELLKRARGGIRPVIGYQAAPRKESLDWQGMVSHTCTLLHMPTMHKIDASWSRIRLEAQAKESGMSVLQDTEMMLNYRLRDRGIKPMIIGAETTHGIERDRNRIHLRSATGRELYGQWAGDRRTPEDDAALTELRKMAGEFGVPLTPPEETASPANIGPSILNLIYHIAPFGLNGLWRKNVQELLSSIHVFNGKRIVAIATGPGMDRPDTVKNAFGGNVREFIEIPNDVELRESASFLALLDRVQSQSHHEATFYAHAKGVTKPDNVAAWSWAQCMYRELLGDIPRIKEILATNPAVGVSFKFETAWIYPGAFFWFRNDALFSKPNWRTLGNDITSEGIGWSVEAYPNRMFFDDGYRIYPKLKYWGDNAGPLYDQAWWNENTPSPEAEIMPPQSDPPHHKYAVRHFGDQWISKLPADGIECGRDDLFDDTRIKWFIEKCGGVSGQSILELGSLEGGHTYLLDQAGANVVGIEANIDSYLRSLVAKEVMGMRRARFLPGDFVAHLRECEQAGRRYDSVVAVGVLYHMTKPLEVLRLVSKCTDRLFLWSHYYDKELITACPCAQQWFWGGLAVQEAGGVRCMGYRHDYGDRIAQPHHIGGVTQYSHWIPRQAILKALSAFGFNSVEICFDEPDHKHGPAFACLAQRT